MSVLAAVSGHLSRIGGVVLHPRSTFSRMIEDKEGTAMEIVPWVLVVFSTITPQSVGHALLLVRARFIDGVVDFAQVLASRMANALFGVLIGAIVLHVLDRMRRPPDERMGFDRAIDVCTFMLVPFLVLTVIGFLLAVLGWNFWWMPHNKMIGDAPTMVIRVAAGFGWSLVLFGLVVRSVWRPRPKAS